MTTAEEYFDLIPDKGSGQLFFLTRKSENEFVLESVIIDTTKKTETINRLKRVMLQSNFIAFPGTPEMQTFMDEVDEDVANSNNKS